MLYEDAGSIPAVSTKFDHCFQHLRLALRGCTPPALQSAPARYCLHTRRRRPPRTRDRRRRPSNSRRCSAHRAALRGRSGPSPQERTSCECGGGSLAPPLLSIASSFWRFRDSPRDPGPRKVSLSLNHPNVRLPLTGYTAPKYRQVLWTFPPCSDGVANTASSSRRSPAAAFEAPSRCSRCSIRAVAGGASISRGPSCPGCHSRSRETPRSAFRSR